MENREKIKHQMLGVYFFVRSNTPYLEKRDVNPLDFHCAAAGKETIIESIAPLEVNLTMNDGKKVPCGCKSSLVKLS